MRLHRLLIASSLWFWLASSQSLIACSVCFDIKDGTRGAFFWTTIFLSLVPLGMIAGGIYAVKHYSSKHLAQNGN